MIRNGWLHTGDVAIMDEEGYFQIVDRIKDMILVSGFNVYPTEVEAVLYHHPKILKCAVVGVPDDTTGERVKAFIVLKPGETATAEEIIVVVPRPRPGAHRLPRAQGDRVPRRAPRDADRQGAAARAAGGRAREARGRVGHARPVNPILWELGDGIVVRTLTPDDDVELFALVDRNRDRLRPWMPWEPTTKGPGDTRDVHRAGVGVRARP